MKFKVIVMHFPKELTQNQEDTLVSNMRAMIRGTKSHINKTIKKLEKVSGNRILNSLPGGSAAGADFFKAQLELVLANMSHYFKLEKIEPGIYGFSYPYEKMKVLGMKLPGINIKGVDLFKSSVFTKPLTKQIFPAMAIKPDDVVFEYLIVEDKTPGQF